ncbi:hypothetical protein C922_03424 [Plasmodium inui San Antonio 1]|uniref:Polycystin domain-containing protein n=1 Tax=Plasmodium inui San Antonio 1 TaxID=1237626 RepID=W7AAX7_9APIC|nr:hypothetical protein C922_03424 [Plasmodium inui San Antonio 1]EUD66229.1 hypothetical protein C922_03424 [Plasmodium inui San Antonio 1]
MDEHEINNLEQIRNAILRKNEKGGHHYTSVINTILLVAHFVLYASIVFVHFSHRNDDFTTCFHEAFSSVVKNEYVSTPDIVVIQTELSDMIQVFNYGRVGFLKYELEGSKNYALSFYNASANTYVEYSVAFHELFNSTIFKWQSSISIRHCYHWYEWVLFLFLNMSAVVVAYRRCIMNILHFFLVALIDLSILYEQFIGTVENFSVHEKGVDLLICSYYLLLILNVLKKLSTHWKVLVIPVQIIQTTVQQNYMLLLFLLSFLPLILINYFSSGEKFQGYFSSVFIFQDDSKYKNEFVYNFFVVIIYSFFFVPMITVASTATTFLLINNHRDPFEFKPRSCHLWVKLREYFFFLKEKNQRVKKRGAVLREKKKKIKIDILKIGSVILFFLFLIFFVLKIFFDQNTMTHLEAHYAHQLEAPFVTKAGGEKSFDTLTQPSEYLQFLSAVVIDNIMRNKKNLDNKKLFKLEAAFEGQNIFVYEDVFHIFPYDVLVKISDGEAVSEEIAVENPLLSDAPATDAHALRQYEDTFDNRKEAIKHYDAYSLLYNFENSLFILLNASFNVQSNGLFRQTKDVFIQEMNEFKNAQYRTKLIILIFLLIATAGYLLLVMYTLYYMRNRFFLLCFGFFFAICVCFFSFNFMTLKSMSHSYDYIEHIKDRNIADTFYLNKLGKFKSLLEDLLRIKGCKFYENFFCHIILVTIVLKIYCFFFFNYFLSFIKYKFHFLFVTASVFIFVSLTSLLSSYTYSNTSIGLQKWTMLFYHVQTSKKYFAYELLISFIFFFFLFYITSIYLYIFLKKNENKVTVKLKESQENSLPFDDLVLDDHDILLHFKAILYTIDKTFEKVRILKERYEVGQLLNQQIEWYNQYCYQKALQENALNWYGPNGCVPQEGGHFPCHLVQAPYPSCWYDCGVASQVESAAQVGSAAVVHREVRSDQGGGRPSSHTSPLNQGGGHLSSHTVPSNQGGDLETNSQEMNTQRLQGEERGDVSRDESSLREDEEVDAVVPCSENYNEVEMVQKTQNMHLFFTKLLNGKYDFGFLHKRQGQNAVGAANPVDRKRHNRQPPKRLLNFFRKGVYDKTALRRRDKKKEQNRTKLKHMLSNLIDDLASIEKIKVSLTYVLFLKIKRHILMRNIRQVNRVTGELKAEYQNRVLYKKHLINMQRKMANEIDEMERDILIRNKLKGTLIRVIDDGTFYQKDEKVEKEINNPSKSTPQSGPGALEEPILPGKQQKGCEATNMK